MLGDVDYWYLVVPDASIVKPGGLPEGWGLLVQAEARLRAKVKAPRLTPEPLTLDFVAGIASAVRRTAMREPLHRDQRMLGLWHERPAPSGTCARGAGSPHRAPCTSPSEPPERPQCEPDLPGEPAPVRGGLAVILPVHQIRPCRWPV